MMKQRIIIGFLCICLASMAFAQERIRIEHGPYLQNLKETETTIVWMASKPSVGWVELAPDDSSTYYQKEREKFFDTTNGVKNTSLLHVVKISGLKPGTGYRYRVYAQEVFGPSRCGSDLRKSSGNGCIWCQTACIHYKRPS